MCIRDRAEAVVLGYISGDAAALYDQGITSSFEYLGVPNADAAAMTYYSQPGNTQANFATATTVLDKQAIILRQKWAALNSINSFSAYADYRKFDYLHTGNAPYPGPLGDTPLSYSPYIDVAKIPLRWQYPTSEYSRNPDNVGAEGTIDQQVNKIWWMQ